MKDIIDMKELTRYDVESIIERGLFFKYSKRPPQSLRNYFVVTAFFEPSTRTKLSFQKAAKTLGARVLDFLPSTSSLNKGETDIDTLLTIQAMDIDCFVIRIRENGAVKRFAEILDIPVVNGGDGTNEHPTQALLDLATMYETFKRLDLKVAIIGDILHSRVARSLTEGLNKFNAEVRMCGPEGFVPKEFPGVEVITNDLREALEGVDVVYALRIQKERIEEVYDNIDEFFKAFQINSESIKFAPSHAILMHPGPFNRNVEVSDDIVYSKRSKILEQVRNGVYTRMAVLETAVGVYQGFQPIQEKVV